YHLDMSKVSIVIPAYNEAEGIAIFHQELLGAGKKLPHGYEIIYVNDGSKDSTLEALGALVNRETPIKIVDLSRNFGKEIATTAGIHYATGDAIIMIDADGQHPPSYLSQFIDKWQAGAQVVVGVR